jgi:hypothetical protein
MTNKKRPLRKVKNTLPSRTGDTDIDKDKDNDKNNINNRNNSDDDDDGMCCCGCNNVPAAESSHTCLETGKKLYAGFCSNDPQPNTWLCQDGTSKTPTGEGYGSIQVCKGCYKKFNPTRDGNDGDGNNDGDGKVVINNNNNRLNRIVNEKDLLALSEHLPAVHENALALCESSTSDEYSKIMRGAVSACKSARDKMRDLNNESYKDTLRILRASRFFNYEYCASQTRKDLEDEMHQLYSVAYFSDHEVLRGLRTELSNYVAAANEFQANDDEDEDPLWTFWRQNRQRLPLFFRAAREVAIAQPSSAAIERLFSYLTNGFNDNQKQALEGIKASQVMVRHNESMRG